MYKFSWWSMEKRRESDFVLYQTEKKDPIIIKSQL